MTTKKKSASRGSSAQGSVQKKSGVKRAPEPLEKHALPPEEELAAMVAELEGESVGAGRLTPHDRIFLARLVRLLSGILSPRFARRAALEGYSMDEHLEGWRLFDTASGRHRTLAMAFEGDVAPETFLDPEKKRIFEQIDSFENLWFPRARFIIARFVPAEHVERFQSAFFRDLKQQPMGPLVVDSVSVFLDRVEALDASDEPGAKEVAATLRRRGLTAKRIATMRELIETVRTSTIPVARRTEEAREADRLQQLGLEQARSWWNDWATTLRPVFDVREQIVLGLAELRVEKLPPAPAPAASAPAT